jgi:hypothetical protein
MLIKNLRQSILLLLITAGFFYSCSDVKQEDRDEEFLNKEIENAKLSEFKGFYFVGSYLGFPSIYLYDFKNDKSKLFWHAKDERVIDLLISPDYKSCYFITKRKQRLKSSQPAIEKGKLYRIDFEIRKVEFITQLEDGLQIIPFWTDNDRFSLVINSIDKTIASYVNKNIQVYNHFGKLLSDNTEIFDLTKDGYPITKLPQINYQSPNQLFTIVEKKDSIIIQHLKSKKEIKTRFVNKKLLQIIWAENNRNLVMLMIPKSDVKNDLRDYKNASLAIFDLQKKKTVKLIAGVGVKHFVLISDFLIFESGIGRDSDIQIFKINSLENIKTIKINGGCGLRSIL